MPSTYAGTATYPTNITIPSDGDGPGIQAADVNAAFEGLADRTAYANTQITALVARRNLVDYQRAAGAALGVSINDLGGPSFQNVTLLTAGVATQVGDIVEVELSVNAGFTFPVGSPAFASLIAKLRANQNGGGLNDIVGSDRGLRIDPPAASGGVIGSMHLLGSFVVATAGTLVIDTSMSLSGTDNNGNSAFANTYAAVMRIWRA